MVGEGSKSNLFVRDGGVRSSSQNTWLNQLARLSLPATSELEDVCMFVCMVLGTCKGFIAPLLKNLCLLLGDSRFTPATG